MFRRLSEPCPASSEFNTPDRRHVECHVGVPVLQGVTRYDRMSDATPPVVTPDPGLVLKYVGELQRYAGRMGNGSDAARLRTSIQGLAHAVRNGSDPTNALRMTQAHINRLDAGLTPQLRRTIRVLRTELGIAHL